jgi:dTDP-4-amino-4,6-dideoxygalactose transaminase
LVIHSSKPAILGGNPLFEGGLNLVIPDLPPLQLLLPGLESILATGIVTKGKYLQSFEEAVADYVGVREAVGLSSCTTGLVLLPRLLGLKGEIILPSFTFMASALGAVWNDLSPVFVDIDADTWTVDPAKVEEAVSERTGAILATHVFGNPAQIEQLQQIANKAGVPLIFDAAHGFGSQYQGRPVGNNGLCEIFSCSPTKLVVCGEGGVLTTNDEELARDARCAREYGNVGNYDLVLPGLNGRMPEFNAVMGLKSLENLETVAVRRNHLARLLQSLLQDVPGIHWQRVSDDSRSSYKDLACRIDTSAFGLSRELIISSLAAEGVVTRCYYDPPCHQQTYWVGRAKVGPSGLPVTELLSKTALTVPLSSRMSEQDIELLAAAFRRLHDFSLAISQRVRAAT